MPEPPWQALGKERVPSRFMPHPADPPAFLHHGHPYGKEPWRQAHAFVAAHAGPDDLVVLHPPYLRLVWDYYARDDGLDTVTLPRETLAADALPPEITEALQGRTRVFLILAHEETEDPDHYFRELHKRVVRTWLPGGRVDAPVRPILFDTSWGVRVAIFNRR